MTASAQWPFPTSDGTTWQYALAREPEQDKAVITRRVVASAKADGKGSLRLEESNNGVVQSTLTLQREHDAVVATARRVAEGQTEQFNPPVTFLPAKLEVGASWNSRGSLAGTGVTVPLTIYGEEAVEVPAGKFRAWHVRGEQAGPVATTAEEWFVRGVGPVKERVTQRAPTGQLLSRHTLELIALPKARDNASAIPVGDFFEATLSTSTGGSAVDTISADALQIVARWRVRHAIGNARIRAVWIAEDTGSIAPPNYQIDEASAVAAAPEAVGTFTLSRPPDGWAPGKYRVDFYVQNTRTATARVTIAARAAPAAAQPP